MSVMPRSSEFLLDEKLYVEDVFSAFAYTGNGPGPQTIQNGIDLAGKGGLVWIKRRNTTSFDHALFDTARGVRKYLSSNLTNAEVTAPAGTNDLYAFNSDGFSVADYNSNVNQSGGLYGSWTFRKAPKFFDIVTYTGNGVAGRQIAHNLGIAPGMIVVKRTDSTGNWQVYHRSVANTNSLVLNTTAASASAATVWNSTDPTDAVFTLGSSTDVNASGGQYVAYIFAHDDSADGIIQCGTFTGPSEINLGWEAQYVLIKRTDGVGSWLIFDTSRGFDLGSADKYLLAESSATEASGAIGNPTATGFSISGGIAAAPYIYLAIRKGLMRPPTDASKVFDIVARNGLGGTAKIVSAIKHGVDLSISKRRNSAIAHSWSDRLRGVLSQLTSDSTAAETTYNTSVTAFNMDGVDVGARTEVNNSAGTYINLFLKQARGFFDIVGYTGTGAARTVPHNLGAVPELMIVKPRVVASWNVFYGDNTKTLILNTTAAAAAAGANIWNFTNPTDTSFSVGTALATSAENVIAYLFASCPGVSKIGTYTGTGAAQNIDCGFTAGARFVMIKRIDSAENWVYFDTVRGITAGNDPYLWMNATNAEVTSIDALSPHAAGFGLATGASPYNAVGGKYLFMALA